MRTFGRDVGRRMAAPLAFVVSFVLVGLVAVAVLVHEVRPAEPAPPPAVSCDQACHAAGLAQAQEKIGAQVAALEKGRRCWPTGLQPAQVIPRTVIVRGALLATENVRALPFDRAWALNTNVSTTDDVWFLAVCA